MTSCATNESLRYIADAPDLSPLYAEADIILVPVQHGGGTKNKTIEAMAWRRPIVGTPQAFTGISATPGEAYVCVPYSARSMAEAIVSLMRDPDRRASLAYAAREYVVSFHSQATVDARVTRLYAQLLGTRQGRDLGRPIR